MKAGLAATVRGIAALGAGAAPAAAQSGGATFYGGGGQAEFERAVGERGLAVDSAEEFEDARPGRGLLGLRTGAPTGPIDDPLDTDTSNDFFQPGQIPAALAFQSNRDNTGTGGPDPVGSRGLAIGRPSSAGAHATPTTISSPFTQEARSAPTCSRSTPRTRPTCSTSRWWSSRSSSPVRTRSAVR